MKIVLAAPFESQTAAGFEMPVNSGPGLIVCDPVTSSTSARLAAFGAGCGRWLHFSAAGLPEMGKTPGWETLDRLRQEFKKKNLQFNAQEIASFSRMAGVTHVAVGNLEGNEVSCTLRYQLWVVPSMQPVGQALTITGSEQQVVAALPGIAGQLATLLRVHARELPPVKMNASDLTVIGELPLCPGPDTSPTDLQKLKNLALKAPLAGLLYLHYCMGANALDGPIIDQLLAQAPRNGMAALEVAQTDLFQLAQHRQLVEQNLKLFPNCYLMTKVGVWLQREIKNPDAELQLAKHAVHCAPQSPEAWLALASTYQSRASRVRKARLANDIPAQQWIFLRRAYRFSLEAAEHAVNLDRRYGMAWQRLSEDACFASEDRLADQAFWTAVSLDKGDTDLYYWGLQMYQPKWLDQSAALEKVARLSVLDHYATPYETVSTGTALQESGLSELANQLLKRAETECHARLKRDPADVYGLRGQAEVYLCQGRASDAEQVFQTLLKSCPQDADAQYKLGMLLENRGLPDDAIAHYEASLRYNPDNQEVQSVLDDCMKKWAAVRAAEQPFRNQIQQQPSSPDGHVNLSRWLINQRRLGEAVAEAREAVRLSPDGLGSLSSLLEALSENHQFQEAMQVGKHALALYPNEVTLHNNLAYVYGKTGQQQASANESQAALRIRPQDALAHENLGDALIALGRKREAQAQWSQVLLLDRAGCAIEAREMLAKYP